MQGSAVQGGETIAMVEVEVEVEVMKRLDRRQ
jgi:hypothetical protein